MPRHLVSPDWAKASDLSSAQRFRGAPTAFTRDRSEKSATAPAAIREKEPVDGSLRTGLFDQIVKRAVVQIRNDQGEVRIDLKLEFLGNVRMQILTENQQVSVRILTELPAVRDRLEAGLQQYAGAVSDAQAEYAAKVIAEKRRLEAVVQRAAQTDRRSPAQA